MAKPWAEVAKSDGYRALSSAEREEARNEYWREVVAPRVPVAELPGVCQAFDADTAPGLVAQIKRQLSPPSLPAAANGASVVSQPSPQPAPEVCVPRRWGRSSPRQRMRPMPRCTTSLAGRWRRTSRRASKTTAPAAICAWPGALSKTKPQQRCQMQPSCATRSMSRLRALRRLTFWCAETRPLGR